MTEEKINERQVGWDIARLIGRGGYGTVYEIRRQIGGTLEKAALKVITIPQNEGDIENLRNNGYDEISISKRYEDYLQDIEKEYGMMVRLKGNANVVQCYDIQPFQHDDGIGWDILIRMELLEALPKSIRGKEISEEEIEKIGKDICRALKACESENILHRDIKPQNIFVAPDGTYKLGDFGIAKIVEHTTGSTKIGTYQYMAPEVYNNEPYGPKADIYSLGLVLYWLLNNRRLPFLPLEMIPSTREEEEARERRMRGEKIPMPAHGNKKMKQIVLKACAYDPEDRYQNAEEMLAALEGRSYVPTAGKKQILDEPYSEEDDWLTRGRGDDPFSPAHKHDPGGKHENPPEPDPSPDPPFDEPPGSDPEDNPDSKSTDSWWKVILFVIGAIVFFVLFFYGASLGGYLLTALLLLIIFLLVREFN